MASLDLQRNARALVHGDLGVEGFCLAFDELLRATVPYDVAAWSTQDPATGLFTSCTMTGIDKDIQREAELFRYEFRDDEPSTYSALIGANRTVSILSEATGGDLDKAARYRQLLEGFGVTDELRAVLWADGAPWGSATLYRLGGRFTSWEAECVASVAPRAAEGLRLVVLRAAASCPEALSDPPGILAVGPDGHVRALTVPAERWLELGARSWSPPRT